MFYFPISTFSVQLGGCTEGVQNFLSRKQPVCTSEWCEKHLPLTSLLLCVLHFSFLNTLCSLSIISQSVCLTGIAWVKKGKRKTRRDIQLSSTADWNCKVILKSERGGERKRRSLARLSHSSRMCVYVSVAQRRWTKEEALTGGWYIAKRLFTLMTSGPPLHHRSIHSFYSIHTAPAISFLSLRPLHSASPLPLAHLAAPRFCCRAPSAALAGTRSC